MCERARECVTLGIINMVHVYFSLSLSERERERDLILTFFDLPTLPVRTAQTILFKKSFIRYFSMMKMLRYISLCIYFFISLQFMLVIIIFAFYNVFVGVYLSILVSIFSGGGCCFESYYNVASLHLHCLLSCKLDSSFCR